MGTGSGSEEETEEGTAGRARPGRARALAVASAPRVPALTAAGAAPGLPWLRLLGGQAVGEWVLLELDDRRGFLFLPVAFATGIALYFGAAREPWAYAGLVPAGLFGVFAVLARARPFAFHLCVLLATIAAGFAVASLQARRIAHPVLARTLQAVEVSGFVEAEERRARGSRITLRVTHLGREIADPPERVRVSLASGDPPPVGAHVRLRATLGPPPGPAYPGGFDFGRAIWFEGIGATGYALGKVQLVPGPEPPAGLAFAAWLERSREAIAGRIRAVLSGGQGGIAVALVTGLRDGVPETVEENMRVSGLSHILSISGLHMALVAMTVFFLARALLALPPELALRYPIKSWAAVPALFAATYYLLLSGAHVPTQRSYVMTLLVLLGVMIGRPALTLRTLAIAALVVMVLTPWAILDPGAQMSFAATLALVAAYERWGQRLMAPSGTTARRWTLRPVRYVAALALTSLVAGLATAPFAAFHFQRLAPLSLLANLAAMPVVSFIVMPMGLLGSMLMPFGWDGPAWRAMGWGLDLMIGIADSVAALPGADRGIAAMPMASLILLSLALTCLCLLRTRLVLAGPLLAGAGACVFLLARPPDLYVDSRARTVAVRGPDGALSLMGTPSTRIAERFEVAQWLSAEGVRAVPAADLTQAARCDAQGCTLAGPDGALVTYSRERGSLAEDCLRAEIVVTPFEPPADCAATVIHIDAWHQLGGVAATRTGPGEWRLSVARPGGEVRPWLPPSPEAGNILLAPAQGVDPAGLSPGRGASAEPVAAGRASAESPANDRGGALDDEPDDDGQRE
ncbi:ComEC/Rec2 family competence protein [Ancylobacter mangrovi]|uniref:ComEC/Rec2 family competence protein n=1 Tax=Ancylobacter mangrovi TaxID=2972472 RepID=UPI002161922D|nr:ComEC/Rec2 family competence protein [Ancylobacter mangrovi]MCS0503402.1 ComEC family competence protein [Ancylobacter mangrovi]